MAQGQKKKIKPPAAKHSTRVQGGNKVIKPKKASLIKQNQIKKKHTSGMAALTEKTLAGKAGHLELLRGGKKDRREATGSLTKKMT